MQFESRAGDTGLTTRGIRVLSQQLQMNCTTMMTNQQRNGVGVGTRRHVRENLAPLQMAKGQFEFGCAPSLFPLILLSR